jgi:hypothetical protein
LYKPEKIMHCQRLIDGISESQEPFLIGRIIECGVDLGQDPDQAIQIGSDMIPRYGLRPGRQGQKQQQQQQGISHMGELKI